MTIIAQHSRKDNGLREVKMHLHMTEIADLIEVCFRDKLDVTARRAVREMRALSRTGPLLWMLGLIPHNGLNWNHGYVFLHDGRVVGSVGAQPSDSGPQAYLIANVAVHPNFRRQGVARGLMLAVLSKAARQGAKCIVLQVDEDNEEAITLYQDLGFDTLTTRTLWLRTNSTAPNLIKRGHNIEIRPANRMDWHDELALLEEFRPEGLFWTDPFRHDQAKPSLWRSLTYLLNARREERWLALDAGQVVGCFHIIYSIYASYHIRLIVRPEYRKEIEQLLLVRALRRIGHQQRHVKIEHPKCDTDTLLDQYEFRPIRTLLWMHKPIP